jgi:hypothetical protein
MGRAAAFPARMANQTGRRPLFRPTVSSVDIDRLRVRRMDDPDTFVQAISRTKSFEPARPGPEGRCLLEFDR